MHEFWEMLAAFICGAGGLAIINVIQERWKWRHDRKAKIQDRSEEKEDKLDEIGKQLTEYIEKQNEYNSRTESRLADMEKNDTAQSEAMKYVLLDRIIYIGQSYIKHGEVTFDERKRLREMHTVYHDGLHGNGDADHIMDAVDALPLKRV